MASGNVMRPGVSTATNENAGDFRSSKSDEEGCSRKKTDRVSMEPLSKLRSRNG